MRCCGLDWSGLRQGQVESSCECSNEPSDFIKCWEVSRVSSRPVPAQVVHSSIELVTSGM
jgi:hypothetical protein